MSLKKFFVNFYFTSIKFIKIYYVIVKIISSIFNIYLFYFSHLYIHSLNFCFFVTIKFNARNIIFNQRPVVINKINSNSSKNCTIYYHQYNIYFAGTAFTRTIFIIIFILKKSYVSQFHFFNSFSTFIN